MNGNKTGYRLWILTLASLLSSPSPGWPQGSAKNGSTSDRAGWALKFLRVAYPDLQGRKLIVTLETYVQLDEEPGIPLNIWHIDVGEGAKDVSLWYSAGCLTRPVTPEDFVKDSSQAVPTNPSAPPTINTYSAESCKPPGPVMAKQFISTAFAFANDGTLRGYNLTSSERGDSEKLKTFIVLVRTHPQMTDKEIAEALKRSGAKYGPEDRDALIKNLPLAALEPLMGKLRVLEARFSPLLENRLDVGSWPDWRITVEATNANGKKLKYEMAIDHFNGDLLSMHRVEK